MNLNSLRVFYHVATKRSFSLAAQSLFITQPAVSKSIRELENQTGLALLERAAKGKVIRLTEPGQVLYAHAKEVFAIEKAAEEALKARAGLTQGKLTLGASSTVANYWLTQYMAEFTRQHPDISLELIVGNSADVENALAHCHIDIGFIEGECTRPDIHAKNWLNEPMVLINAAKTNWTSISAQQLNNATWLLRERGSGTRSVVDNYFLQHGLKPQNSIIFGSNESIVNGVANGLGIAIVPQVVAESLIKIGQITPLTVPPQWLPKVRPLFSLTFKGRPLSPSATSFLAQIQGKTNNQD
ncbi:LysR family transcriptional regulator [Alteromonas sp. C1M14]|uniref:LysR family transcriptional regulator n=1 Tax=Alteromonas sp. C1M14 TaxID=2841567 RepID=UPI001C085538|nr:LysR family transcriptional regulator [Alteromonas sp. C1M14]MBU2976701.1 LysR family transcriptional regulator [Alteromonas sp. C1M14]